MSEVYDKARPGNSYKPVGWSGDEEVRENNKSMELTSNRAEFYTACRGWVWEGQGTRSAI